MNKDEDQNQKPKMGPPQQKRVFDVVRPGKSMASPNSRNVITGHKPQVKEDMFVAGPNSRLAGNPYDKHALMNAGHKSVSVPGAPEAPKGDVSQFEPAALAAAAPTEAEQKKTAAIIAEAAKDLDPVEPTAPTLPKGPLPSTSTKSEQPEEEKPTPGQIAMEGSVEVPAVETNPEPTSPAPSNLDDDLFKQITGDDLLAETGAPQLEQTIISHHKHHTAWWEWVLILLLIVVVAVVALNFLVDAEVLKLDVDVPHTNLIK